MKPTRPESFASEGDPVETTPRAGYTEKDLENLFTYHAPFGDQAERYKKISEAFKEAARVVLQNTPSCADQTVAIRQIMLARMLANSVIAVNEPRPDTQV